VPQIKFLEDGTASDRHGLRLLSWEPGAWAFAQGKPAPHPDAGLMQLQIEFHALSCNLEGGGGVKSLFDIVQNIVDMLKPNREPHIAR
jgi:hypothetical protein